MDETSNLKLQTSGKPEAPNGEAPIILVRPYRYYVSYAHNGGYGSAVFESAEVVTHERQVKHWAEKLVWAGRLQGIQQVTILNWKLLSGPGIGLRILDPEV